jgi:hypothetical protein
MARGARSCRTGALACDSHHKMFRDRSRRSMTGASGNRGRCPGPPRSASSAAERTMINRVLNGLRYSYEDAGPIWESLDISWHATPP